MSEGQEVEKEEEERERCGLWVGFQWRSVQTAQLDSTYCTAPDGSLPRHKPPFPH